MHSFSRLILAVTLLFLTTLPAFAQEDAAPAGEEVTVISFDQRVDEFIAPVADAFSGIVFYSVEIFGSTPEVPLKLPLILVWLVLAAVFFTFYFGFINVRFFNYAWRLLFEKPKSDEISSEGEISRFKALSTSVSGTVGLGNIAGVAVAISVGGPGAMVWMIFMGIFGMSTKFVECAMGVRYRHQTAEGHFSGGPMYYLKEGFAERGWPKLGWSFGAFFSICCIGGALGGGNMFQVNQAFQQFVNVTGGEASFMADKGWLFGLIVACLVAAVIIGGIRSIANVASKIVPVMALVYFIGAAGVIIMNIEAVPAAIGTIFRSAFDLSALGGGFLGAIIQGVRRAAFSNEAGIGSASIAHAAVKTDSHVSQGMVAMLEPFIDTVVICSLTALVIVVSGVYVGGEGMEGVELTSRAFGGTFAFFPYILALAVCLFAFSSMIAWSYYGLKSFTYLFGETPRAEVTFKVLYCLITIVGGAAQMNNIINFMDAAIFAMAVPNIIGLYVMAPMLKRDVKAYLAKVKNN